MRDAVTGPEERSLTAGRPPAAELVRWLAAWAAAYRPSPEDRELARRALLDTVGVALAAKDEPVVRAAVVLPPESRFATAAHALDYDDLHVPTTTHVSAVCVPAALALGGDEVAYLAGAGVMVRLGALLGWEHYRQGWHVTCTAGAFGSAVAAGVALGFSEEALAQALSLAVPGAGGVHAAFGTHGKPLQVGFAVATGVRAARLVAAGARSSLEALQQWLGLVRGAPAAVGALGDAAAVPGGLAAKRYPCCYALQRVVAAGAQVRRQLEGAEIAAVRCATSRGSVAPLRIHRPRTGLEAKFSLEYGIAAALIDDEVSLASFSDAAVKRPEIAELMERITVELSDETGNVLAGSCAIEVTTAQGRRLAAETAFPPGAPERPLTEGELWEKVGTFFEGGLLSPAELQWKTAGHHLERAGVTGERGEHDQ